MHREMHLVDPVLPPVESVPIFIRMIQPAHILPATRKAPVVWLILIFQAEVRLAVRLFTHCCRIIRVARFPIRFLLSSMERAAAAIPPGTKPEQGQIRERIIRKSAPASPPISGAIRSECERRHHL